MRQCNLQCDGSQQLLLQLDRVRTHKDVLLSTSSGKTQLDKAAHMLQASTENIIS